MPNNNILTIENLSKSFDGIQAVNNCTFNVAVELGLFHPINGEEMKFEAELPQEFQKLMRVLKKSIKV